LPYIGRFAPSPTGPLHLGSLYTALASYLDARANRGHWLLRIDDLDTPRIKKGSTASILKTLERFGLCWDGQIYYQSQHIDVYEAALQRLLSGHLLYPCTCSRKQLSDHSQTGNIYPGTCRLLSSEPTSAFALRVKTNLQPISFYDLLQGEIVRNLAQQDGDFIIKRKDQIIAYQLAVVIDDQQQAISHVVRGLDLLYETPKQLYLQQKLGITQPIYAHIPIVTDTLGQKLSKQSHAPAVKQDSPSAVLFKLLQWLKQSPPAVLKNSATHEILSWAILNWKPNKLQGQQSIRTDSLPLDL
jgi:glutamyl-Q tRNA(Asp) synthetase